MSFEPPHGPHNIDCKHFQYDRCYVVFVLKYGLLAPSAGHKLKQSCK